MLNIWVFFSAEVLGGREGDITTAREVVIKHHRIQKLNRSLISPVSDNLLASKHVEKLLPRLDCQQRRECQSLNMKNAWR